MNEDKMRAMLGTKKKDKDKDGVKVVADNAEKIIGKKPDRASKIEQMLGKTGKMDGKHDAIEAMIGKTKINADKLKETVSFKKEEKEEKESEEETDESDDE